MLTLVFAVKDFATVGVNDILLLSGTPFLNDESLIFTFGLGGSEDTGTILGSLNGKIGVIFLALQVVVGAFLLEGKLLVFTSIAIPQDSGSLVLAILSHIDDASAMNRADRVVGLSELAVLIVVSLEEAEHCNKIWIMNIMLFICLYRESRSKSDLPFQIIFIFHLFLVFISLPVSYKFIH